MPRAFAVGSLAEDEVKPGADRGKTRGTTQFERVLPLPTDQYTRYVTCTGCTVPFPHFAWRVETHRVYTYELRVWGECNALQGIGGALSSVCVCVKSARFVWLFSQSFFFFSCRSFPCWSDDPRLFALERPCFTRSRPARRRSLVQKIHTFN